MKAHNQETFFPLVNRHALTENVYCVKPFFMANRLLLQGCVQFIKCIFRHYALPAKVAPLSNSEWRIKNHRSNCCCAMLTVLCNLLWTTPCLGVSAIYDGGMP